MSVLSRTDCIIHDAINSCCSDSLWCFHNRIMSQCIYSNSNGLIYSLSLHCHASTGPINLLFLTIQLKFQNHFNCMCPYEIQMHLCKLFLHIKKKKHVSNVWRNLILCIFLKNTPWFCSSPKWPLSILLMFWKQLSSKASAVSWRLNYASLHSFSLTDHWCYAGQAVYRSRPSLTPNQ